MVIITFKPTQPLTKVAPNSVRRGLKGGDSPLSPFPPLAKNIYYYIRNGQCNAKYTIANTNHPIFVYSRLFSVAI